MVVSSSIKKGSAAGKALAKEGKSKSVRSADKKGASRVVAARVPAEHGLVSHTFKPLVRSFDGEVLYEVIGGKKHIGRTTSGKSRSGEGLDGLDFHDRAEGERRRGLRSSTLTPADMAEEAAWQVALESAIKKFDSKKGVSKQVPLFIAGGPLALDPVRQARLFASMKKAEEEKALSATSAAAAVDGISTSADEGRVDSGDSSTTILESRKIMKEFRGFLRKHAHVLKNFQKVKIAGQEIGIGEEIVLEDLARELQEAYEAAKGAGEVVSHEGFLEEANKELARCLIAQAHASALLREKVQFLYVKGDKISLPNPESENAKAELQASLLSAIRKHDLKSEDLRRAIKFSAEFIEFAREHYEAYKGFDNVKIGSHQVKLSSEEKPEEFAEKLIDLFKKAKKEDESLTKTKFFKEVRRDAGRCKVARKYAPDVSRFKSIDFKGTKVSIPADEDKDERVRQMQEAILEFGRKHNYSPAELDNAVMESGKKHFMKSLAALRGGVRNHIARKRLRKKAEAEEKARREAPVRGALDEFSEKYYNKFKKLVSIKVAGQDVRIPKNGDLETRKKAFSNNLFKAYKESGIDSQDEFMVHLDRAVDKYIGSVERSLRRMVAKGHGDIDRRKIAQDVAEEILGEVLAQPAEALQANEFIRVLGQRINIPYYMDPPERRVSVFRERLEAAAKEAGQNIGPFLAKALEAHKQKMAIKAELRGFAKEHYDVFKKFQKVVIAGQEIKMSEIVSADDFARRLVREYESPLEADAMESHNHFLEEANKELDRCKIAENLTKDSDENRANKLFDIDVDSLTVFGRKLAVPNATNSWDREQKAKHTLLTFLRDYKPAKGAPDRLTSEALRREIVRAKSSLLKREEYFKARLKGKDVSALAVDAFPGLSQEELDYKTVMFAITETNSAKNPARDMVREYVHNDMLLPDLSATNPVVPVIARVMHIYSHLPPDKKEKVESTKLLGDQGFDDGVAFRSLYWAFEIMKGESSRKVRFSEKYKQESNRLKARDLAEVLIHEDVRDLEVYEGGIIPSPSKDKTKFERVEELTDYILAAQEDLGGDFEECKEAILFQHHYQSRTRDLSELQKEYLRRRLLGEDNKEMAEAAFPEKTNKERAYEAVKFALMENDSEKNPARIFFLHCMEGMSDVNSLEEIFADVDPEISDESFRVCVNFLSELRQLSVEQRVKLAGCRIFGEQFSYEDIKLADLLYSTPNPSESKASSPTLGLLGKFKREEFEKRKLAEDAAKDLIGKNLEGVFIGGKFHKIPEGTKAEKIKHLSSIIRDSFNPHGCYFAGTKEEFKDHLKMVKEENSVKKKAEENVSRGPSLQEQLDDAEKRIEEEAAETIQRMERGRQGRKAAADKRRIKLKAQKEEAATKLQAIARGRQARSDLAEQEKAAAKIQKVERGRKGRKVAAEARAAAAIDKNIAEAQARPAVPMDSPFAASNPVRGNAPAEVSEAGAAPAMGGGGGRAKSDMPERREVRPTQAATVVPEGYVPTGSVSTSAMPDAGPGVTRRESKKTKKAPGKLITQATPALTFPEVSGPVPAVVEAGKTKRVVSRGRKPPAEVSEAGAAPVMGGGGRAKSDMPERREVRPTQGATAVPEGYVPTGSVSAPTKGLAEVSASPVRRRRKARSPKTVATSLPAAQVSPTSLLQEAFAKIAGEIVKDPVASMVLNGKKINFTSYKQEDIKRQLMKSFTEQKDVSVDEFLRDIAVSHAKAVEAESLAREERAAKTIQRMERGRKGRLTAADRRQKLKEEIEAATKIQSIARKIHAKTEYKNIQDAILRIQRMERGRQARKQLKDKEKAVTKLQAIARGRKVRKEIADKEKSATKIQSAFRGYKEKKFVEEEILKAKIQELAKKIMADPAGPLKVGGKIISIPHGGEEKVGELVERILVHAPAAMGGAKDYRKKYKGFLSELEAAYANNLEIREEKRKASREAFVKSREERAAKREQSRRSKSSRVVEEESYIESRKKKAAEHNAKVKSLSEKRKAEAEVERVKRASALKKKLAAAAKRRKESLLKVKSKKNAKLAERDLLAIDRQISADYDKLEKQSKLAEREVSASLRRAQILDEKREKLKSRNAKVAKAAKSVNDKKKSLATKLQAIARGRKVRKEEAFKDAVKENKKAATRMYEATEMTELRKEARELAKQIVNSPVGELVVNGRKIKMPHGKVKGKEARVDKLTDKILKGSKDESVTLAEYIKNIRGEYKRISDEKDAVWREKAAEFERSSEEREAAYEAEKAAEAEARAASRRRRRQAKSTRNKKFDARSAQAQEQLIAQKEVAERRRIAAEQEVKKQAAETMQRVERGRQGRKAAADKRRQKLEAQQEAAATKIQALARGKKARREVAAEKEARDEAAAKIIQDIARKYLAKKSSEKEKQLQEAEMMASEDRDVNEILTKDGQNKKVKRSHEGATTEQERMGEEMSGAGWTKKQEEYMKARMDGRATSEMAAGAFSGESEEDLAFETVKFAFTEDDQEKNPARPLVAEFAQKKAAVNISNFGDAEVAALDRVLLAYEALSKEKKGELANVDVHGGGMRLGALFTGHSKIPAVYRYMKDHEGLKTKRVKLRRERAAAERAAKAAERAQAAAERAAEEERRASEVRDREARKNAAIELAKEKYGRVANLARALDGNKKYARALIDEELGLNDREDLNEKERQAIRKAAVKVAQDKVAAEESQELAEQRAVESRDLVAAIKKAKKNKDDIIKFLKGRNQSLPGKFTDLGERLKALADAKTEVGGKKVDKTLKQVELDIRALEIFHDRIKRDRDAVTRENLDNAIAEAEKDRVREAKRKEKAARKAKKAAERAAAARSTPPAAAAADSVAPATALPAAAPDAAEAAARAAEAAPPAAAALDAAVGPALPAAETTMVPISHGNLFGGKNQEGVKKVIEALGGSISGARVIIPPVRLALFGGVLNILREQKKSPKSPPKIEDASRALVVKGSSLELAGAGKSEVSEQVREAVLDIVHGKKPDPDLAKIRGVLNMGGGRRLSFEGADLLRVREALNVIRGNQDLMKWASQKGTANMLIGAAQQASSSVKQRGGALAGPKRRELADAPAATASATTPPAPAAEAAPGAAVGPARSPEATEAAPPAAVPAAARSEEKERTQGRKGHVAEVRSRFEGSRPNSSGTRTPSPGLQDAKAATAGVDVKRRANKFEAASAPPAAAARTTAAPSSSAAAAATPPAAAAADSVTPATAPPATAAAPGAAVGHARKVPSKMIMPTIEEDMTGEEAAAEEERAEAAEREAAPPAASVASPAEAAAKSGREAVEAGRGSVGGSGTAKPRGDMVSVKVVNYSESYKFDEIEIPRDAVERIKSKYKVDLAKKGSDAIHIFPQGFIGRRKYENTHYVLNGEEIDDPSLRKAIENGIEMARKGSSRRKGEVKAQAVEPVSSSRAGAAAPAVAEGATDSVTPAANAAENAAVKKAKAEEKKKKAEKYKDFNYREIGAVINDKKLTDDEKRKKLFSIISQIKAPQIVYALNALDGQRDKDIGYIIDRLAENRSKARRRVVGMFLEERSSEPSEKLADKYGFALTESELASKKAAAKAVKEKSVAEEARQAAIDRAKAPKMTKAMKQADQKAFDKIIGDIRNIENKQRGVEEKDIKVHLQKAVKMLADKPHLYQNKANREKVAVVVREAGKRGQDYSEVVKGLGLAAKTTRDSLAAARAQAQLERREEQLKREVERQAKTGATEPSKGLLAAARHHAEAVAVAESHDRTAAEEELAAYKRYIGRKNLEGEALVEADQRVLDVLTAQAEKGPMSVMTARGGVRGSLARGGSSSETHRVIEQAAANAIRKKEEEKANAGKKLTDKQIQEMARSRAAAVSENVAEESAIDAIKSEGRSAEGVIRNQEERVEIAAGIVARAIIRGVHAKRKAELAANTAEAKAAKKEVEAMKDAEASAREGLDVVRDRTLNTAAAEVTRITRLHADVVEGERAGRLPLGATKAARGARIGVAGAAIVAAETAEVAQDAAARAVERSLQREGEGKGVSAETVASPEVINHMGSMTASVAAARKKAEAQLRETVAEIPGSDPGMAVAESREDVVVDARRVTESGEKIAEVEREKSEVARGKLKGAEQQGMTDKERVADDKRREQEATARKRHAERLKSVLGELAEKRKADIAKAQREREAEERERARQEAARTAAASRETAAERAAAAPDAVEAASMIQRMERGRQGRKAAADKRRQKLEAQQEAAATKIQALARGKKLRREVAAEKKAREEAARGAEAPAASAADTAPETSTAPAMSGAKRDTRSEVLEAALERYVRYDTAAPRKEGETFVEGVTEENGVTHKSKALEIGELYDSESGEKLKSFETAKNAYRERLKTELEKFDAKEVEEDGKGKPPYKGFEQDVHRRRQEVNELVDREVTQSMKTAKSKVVNQGTNRETLIFRDEDGKETSSVTAVMDGDVVAKLQPMLADGVSPEDSEVITLTFPRVPNAHGHDTVVFEYDEHKKRFVATGGTILKEPEQGKSKLSADLIVRLREEIKAHKDKEVAQEKGRGALSGMAGSARRRSEGAEVQARTLSDQERHASGTPAPTPPTVEAAAAARDAEEPAVGDASEREGAALEEQVRSGAGAVAGAGASADARAAAGEVGDDKREDVAARGSDEGRDTDVPTAKVKKLRRNSAPGALQAVRDADASPEASVRQRASTITEGMPVSRTDQDKVRRQAEGVARVVGNPGSGDDEPPKSLVGKFRNFLGKRKAQGRGRR